LMSILAAFAYHILFLSIYRLPELRFLIITSLHIMGLNGVNFSRNQFVGLYAELSRTKGIA
jgi:hypothetical protein